MEIDDAFATSPTTVIGGGVIGASCAVASSSCEAKHHQVLLLEQFDEIGHTHGSSHGDGRIFR